MALKSPAVWLSGDKSPDVPSFDGVLPSQFIILIVGIKRELGLREVGTGFDKEKKLGKEVKGHKAEMTLMRGEVADALTSISPALHVFCFFGAPFCTEKSIAGIVSWKLA